MSSSPLSPSTNAMQRAWNALYVLCGVPLWYVVEDGEATFVRKLVLRPAVAVLQAAAFFLLRHVGLIACAVAMAAGPETDRQGEGPVDLLVFSARENGYSQLDVWVSAAAPYFGDLCGLAAFLYIAKSRAAIEDIATKTVGLFRRYGREVAVVTNDSVKNTVKV